MAAQAGNWAVSAERLIKRYPNGHLALEGVDLQIRRGEVFGLLGQNGAGKTTLLKILCGLLQPCRGRLRILDMEAKDGFHHIKRCLGVVSQDINLDQPLTVLGNLQRHCSYFSIPRRQASARIAEWLHILQLEHAAHQSIHQLSGGNKRKVMIARAFITEPQLLILDEPTNALDPSVRSVVWDRICAFADQGGTVLLSTHHFQEAEHLCGRVELIHQGRLQTLDSAESLESRFHALTANEAA
ncbi:multidrug ABC transporter ATP-binding protein [Methylomonas koyamae]|uniref:Multidrug ABC transporter ATP-binding protein n=1 Tax=Methylomonas koyamae TaxID=702114 RepID=A0A177N7Y7_9GAMM|nr:ABC transporter ATP-binding protein [Methylomonas koyamae]OAI13982.1 multidrug ABC transporter ATP-binding protein [Methylomonas koyamae]